MDLNKEGMTVKVPGTRDEQEKRRRDFKRGGRGGERERVVK